MKTCIKEVIGGEEYKKDVSKWMQEGERSDKNIADFAVKNLSN